MIKEEITSKAGFPFYVDYWDKYFLKMSGDQVKEVLEIIFHFNKTFEVMETTDLAIEMVVTTIIDNLKRDAERRIKQSNASKANGLLGGRPRKEENPDNPLGLNKAKKGDNVNDKDKDKEDKKTKAKKDLLKIEKEKILRKDFEEVYTIFKDGARIIKFPFDNFRTLFENCLLDRKLEGGFKYVKQQTIDYLAFLKAHNKIDPKFQRSKMAFEVFINSRSKKQSHCTEDWKHKTKELIPFDPFAKELAPRKTQRQIWQEQQLKQGEL